jgi:preprotein translocase subunit SecA
VPIISKMVSRQIESAQSQIEGHNGEIRKNVLKYDEVMNNQRTVIYDERRKVLNGEDVSEQIGHFIDDTLEAYVAGATSEGYAEDWDLDELWSAFKQLYPIGITHKELVKKAGGLTELDAETLLEAVKEDAHEVYASREEEFGEEVLRKLERRVLLQTIDRKWREHLYEVDYLKQGISLRAYAQRDPVIEYQREAFDMFQTMLDGIKEESVRFLMNAELKQKTEGTAEPEAQIRGLEPLRKPEMLTQSAPSMDTASGVEQQTTTEDGAVFKRPPKPVPGQKRAVKRTPGAGSKGAAKVAPKSARSAGPRKASTAPPAKQANPQQRQSEKVGPNEPCPCGSGKKYKRCHGAPGGAAD